MSETYHLRQRMIDIARRDVGKVEVTKNRAPWIKWLWPATSYPKGYDNREPYCAAGLCYVLREWLKDKDVRAALDLNTEAAEKWRCKSAVAFDWIDWAVNKKLRVLDARTVLHAADLVVYDYSHIEMVTDDDGTTGGPFVAIGYNTNAAGSRDGEGCFEKPRLRARVKKFIRIMP